MKRTKKPQVKNDLTAQKLELLVQALDKSYPPIPQLMMRSFIQGIFVGLGTTVGVSLVLGILTYLVAQANIIPGSDSVLEFLNQS